VLEIDNNSDDETHRFITSEGTTLTVYNDGTEKNNRNLPRADFLYTEQIGTGRIICDYTFRKK